MEERVESKLLEIFQQAKSNHSDCLESATRTLLNSNDLERKIFESHDEALNYFKNHTQFGDLDRNKELIENLLTNMQDKDKSCRVDMKRRIEKHYNEVLNDCKIQYKKLMDMKMMTFNVINYVAIWTTPVSEMHIDSKRTTLILFNSKLEVRESNLLDQFKEELQDFMDIERVNYEAAFQKHRSDMATAALTSGAAATGFTNLLGFLGDNADIAQ
ncbi:hypothetical protein B566_EDAN017319 [Ephemera danica]|nr:hypothetical protein B566_EDAN017319 [Ephemera danica]